jgi:hypothetical protein
LCRALGAEDRGTIAQRDTYFKVARGGLKLREEQPGRPHLIQFERTSEPRQRESRYRIIEVSDGTALCAALAAAIGIRGIVVKRRRLLCRAGTRKACRGLCHPCRALGGRASLPVAQRFRWKTGVHRWFFGWASRGSGGRAGVEADSRAR